MIICLASLWFFFVYAVSSCQQKKKGLLAEPQHNDSRLSRCYIIADSGFHTKTSIIWHKQVDFNVDSNQILEC